MNTTNPDSSPIKDLKAVVSGFDREINDQGLSELKKELIRLTGQWKEDTVLQAFIKMLFALQKYMGSKKQACHPETLEILKEILEGLETVADASSQLTGPQKELIAGKALGRFKEFKKTLAEQARSSSLQPGELKKSVSSLAGLKEILLSLEWEITDATILALGNETRKLKSAWHESKLCQAFLEMIQVVGRYIGAKKAHSHKDSILLLHSIYHSFASILGEPAMPMARKKEIFKGELKKFHAFKSKVASSTPGREKEIPVPEPSVPSGPNNPMDDLITTRTEKISPAGKLFEEIHLSDVLDEKSLPRKPDSGVQEMKEIQPNRLNVEAMPEIDRRLDEFFDEDTAMSELAFSDKGDTVVPYLAEEGAGLTGTMEETDPETVDEDDDEAIVPFQFDDDFKENDNKTEADEEPVLQDQETLEMQKLKSSIQAMADDFYPTHMESASKSALRLKALWEDRPEPLILLQMINSVLSHLSLAGDKPDPEASNLLDRGYTGLEKQLSGQEHGPEAALYIIDALSGYMDWQAAKIKALHPSPTEPGNGGQPLDPGDGSAPTDSQVPGEIKKPEVPDEAYEAITDMKEPAPDDKENPSPRETGFWAGVKAFLGFTKSDAGKQP